MSIVYLLKLQKKRMNIMKRMNYKRRLISYSVIWSVLFSSLLIYSPTDIVLSAPGDPLIEIITPEEGSVFDEAMVEFTGKVSDDSTTPDKLTIKVVELLSDTEESMDPSIEELQTVANIDELGQWTFSKEFSEGKHTISFTVENESGATNSATSTFTVNQAVTEVSTDLSPAEEEENIVMLDLVLDNETETRPFIVDMKIIPNDITDVIDFLPAEDMTQVPLDSNIMIVIREPGVLTDTQPILIVSSSSGDKIGIEGTVPKRIDGSEDYEIIFTPVSELEANTTFYVYADPNFSNESGAKIFPKTFKFTTVSLLVVKELHGGYSNNTNSCAYCHSTHNGKNAKLEGGEYGSEAGNYCMACHDGTNGSPMVDKFNSDHKHFQAKEGMIENSESCTSCHNPHQSPSKDNPNMLQSVLEYDNPEKTESHFRTFSYKKSVTATGISEDFSLCFRCHDGVNASNIQQYYEEETLLANSGHNIMATDGSALNGQMPCADCHETHGSNNLYSLKDNLGHIMRDDKDKFSSGNEWTPSVERDFCLKCHNNTIELYGKTATLNDKNDLDVTIEGHAATDVESCSTCHGSSEDPKERLRSAAHAPMRLTSSPPPASP